MKFFQVDFSLQSLWLTDTRPIEQYYRVRPHLQSQQQYGLNIFIIAVLQQHLLSPNGDLQKDLPTYDLRNPKALMDQNEWQQVLVHYVREGNVLQRVTVLLDRPRILIIPDALHEIKVLFVSIMIWILITDHNIFF